MKTLMATLALAAAGLAAAPAQAACVTVQQAYSMGQSVGEELCNALQKEYANQMPPQGATPGNMMCDVQATIACKAGFRDGFNSGGAVDFGGLHVPSCQDLYSLDWNSPNGTFGSGSTQDLFKSLANSLCNSSEAEP